jgi:putative ABC transport system ATP-binding protein
LDNVTLSVEKGKWINILGPSGSGKTTLLNVVGGLLSLSSGTLEVDGEDISQLKGDDLQSYRREKIGYVFQDYRLFDQFTVLENVILPQLPYEPRKKIEEKAKTLLEQLQMSHRINALPRELSGGEKQRTAIARALLHEPSILLCDEPTGNLDAENRERILQILKDLHDQGMTILLVTHDVEVTKWGDEILYIRDGRIQENTPVLLSE